MLRAVRTKLHTWLICFIEVSIVTAKAKQAENIVVFSALYIWATKVSESIMLVWVMRVMMGGFTSH